eukprot:9625879-Alexandrium_andersonii.AAC.1
MVLDAGDGRMYLSREGSTSWIEAMLREETEAVYEGHFRLCKLAVPIAGAKLLWQVRSWQDSG